jgi:hypothetical protein
MTETEKLCSGNLAIDLGFYSLCLLDYIINHLDFPANRATVRIRKFVKKLK